MGERGAFAVSQRWSLRGEIYASTQKCLMKLLITTSPSPSVGDGLVGENRFLVQDSAHNLLEPPT